MSPLPQASPPSWRQYAVRGMIWIAFVGAVAYSARNGGFDFLADEVSLNLEPNRDTVSLAGNEPATIEIKITLKNNTAKSAALTAASACRVFRWQIFSRSGEMMQSKAADDKCPDTPVSAGLGSGQQLQEIYAINLAKTRYKPGTDYQVRIWYWGYEGEFQFTTE